MITANPLENLTSAKAHAFTYHCQRVKKHNNLALPSFHLPNPAQMSLLVESQ